MRMNSRGRAALAFAALATFSILTTAGAGASDHHGDAHDEMHTGGAMHGSTRGVDIGEPGEPSEISRTVRVVMADNRFQPARIAVHEGETIRFVLQNNDNVVHEFSIGTAQMHAAHRKEMAMMVERGVLEVDHINRERMNMEMGDGHMMTHDDPNSRLLEPGKSAEIVWKFSTDASLEFACNVPGHYDAGMVGHIVVTH